MLTSGYVLLFTIHVYWIITATTRIKSFRLFFIITLCIYVCHSNRRHSNRYYSNRYYSNGCHSEHCPSKYCYNKRCHSDHFYSNRCIKNHSKPTIAIATVAIETIAIVTVAITTVAIATVNLTTVIIASSIRSFKVLLGGVMINSTCMTDCYPPVTVGGGGVLVILSLPRGCYYLFYHPLSHLSSYLMYHLKLLFGRCLKYIHSNT